MNLWTSILNRVTASPTVQVIAGSLLAPNKVLCFKLLWMAKNDQHERQAFLNGKPWNNQIDRRNTQIMKKIVAQYGWPGEKQVGQLGAQAAWLLVQHADHDRAFQKQCHSLLAEAVKRNDAQAKHLAYLTDRVCVGDGVPQIYGTQFEYPIADQEHVDERRAAVGLSSLAEYLAESNKFRRMIKK
ncbi:MAG: hypothetical protein EHM40_12990 [Chloroflexi bacterium]|nr:MAG: hypothetical protein EHM40_12990 [Chloroflexota bacterium]